MSTTTSNLNYEEEDLTYLQFFSSSDHDLSLEWLDGKLDCSSPLFSNNSEDNNFIFNNNFQLIPVETNGKTSNTKCSNNIYEEFVVSQPQLTASGGETKKEADVIEVRCTMRKKTKRDRDKFVSYELLPTSKVKYFKCEICGNRLASLQNRRRHLLTKHIKQKNYSCSICSKQYVFNFSLKLHMIEHSDNPMYDCVCGKQFKRRDYFMHHLQLVHSPRDPASFTFHCHTCNKKFLNNRSLRGHINAVHSMKNIACQFEGCRKMFSTISLMSTHARYHSNLRFKCDGCDAHFSTQSYLAKHRLSHKGVRPYICSHCGKDFLCISHLNQHVKHSHCALRKFCCSVCDKQYNTQTNLSDHMCVHTGEKPFQCNECSFSTAYRNAFYAHRKKHKLQL